MSTSPHLHPLNHPPTDNDLEALWRPKRGRASLDVIHTAKDRRRRSAISPFTVAQSRQHSPAGWRTPVSRAQSPIGRVAAPGPGQLSSHSHGLGLGHGLSNGNGQGHSVVVSVPVKKAYALRDAFGVVLGCEIGVGIFVVPGMVVASMTDVVDGNMWIWVLGIWGAAGVSSLCGALSLLEMASLMSASSSVDGSKGIQEYLKHSYNDSVGFMASLTQLFVAQPAALGAVALIGAEYVCNLIGTEEGDDVPNWVVKLTAAIVLVIMASFSCCGVRAGKKMMTTGLVLRLLALGGIVMSGFAIWRGSMEGGSELVELTRQTSIFSSTAAKTQYTSKGLWSLSGGLTIAIMVAQEAYSGWETLGSVTSNLHDSQREVPRTLGTALLFVIMLFVATNAAYLAVVPLEAIKVGDTVAMSFSHTTLGITGSILTTLVILISCLILISFRTHNCTRQIRAAVACGYFPRFLYPPSKKGIHEPTPHEVVEYVPLPHQPHMPSGLGPGGPTGGLKRRHEYKWRTVSYRKDDERPVRAILLATTLSLLFLLCNSLRALLIITAITTQFPNLIAIFGLFRLRHRLRPRLSSVNPDSPSINEPAGAAGTAYRTSVVNPAVYCGVTGFVVLRALVEVPWVGMGVVVLNAVGMFLHRRKTKGSMK